MEMMIASMDQMNQTNRHLQITAGLEEYVVRAQQDILLSLIFTICGWMWRKKPSVTIQNPRWMVTKSVLPPCNRFGWPGKPVGDYPNTETVTETDVDDKRFFTCVFLILFAENRTCPDTNLMYLCSNNRCIYRRWMCDGEDDCRNGEDEIKEHCSSKFSCFLTCRYQLSETVFEEVLIWIWNL